MHTAVSSAFAWLSKGSLEGVERQAREEVVCGQIERSHKRKKSRDKEEGVGPPKQIRLESRGAK